MNKLKSILATITLFIINISVCKSGSLALIDIKPNKINTYLPKFIKSESNARRNNNCLISIAGICDKNPYKISLYQVWKNQESFMNHLSSQETLDLIEISNECIKKYLWITFNPNKNNLYPSINKYKYSYMAIKIFNVLQHKNSIAVQILSELSNSQQKESDCLISNVNKTIGNNNQLILFEVWKNKESLYAYLKRDTYKQFLEKISKTISQKPILAISKSLIY